MFAAYGQLTAVMIFLALIASLVVLPCLLLVVTKANNISDQELKEHYRVFVAYNNQLPQILMRTNAPAALEEKRLIVRVSKWPLSSPFPYG